MSSRSIVSVLFLRVVGGLAAHRWRRVHGCFCTMPKFVALAPFVWSVEINHLLRGRNDRGELVLNAKRVFFLPSKRGNRLFGEVKFVSRATGEGQPADLY